MTEHTAGPWEVHSEDLEDCHFRVRGTLVGTKFKVANCPYVPGFKSSRSEAEANAHLIAAAPELLEACKNAPIPPAYPAAILAEGDILSWLNAYAEWWNVRSAAIAKAKSKS